MMRGLAALLLSFGAVATASADSRVLQPERGDSVNEDSNDLVAIHPHNDMVIPLYPSIGAAGANTNVIFMNKCTGGCSVSPGTDDSRTNRSSIVNRTGTLGAFPYPDAAWQAVMTCVRQTFAPFNVQITDVDPGTADHLEIMTGNLPSQLGFNSQTGGVAPFPCQAFVPNALVFAFAGIWGSGSTCGAQCVTNICATAAQEIAHSWALDHVTDPSDPMTYYGQNDPTPKHYKNAQDQCGSDCVGGQGPFGQSCTGANSQSHACSCTNQQTQNSFTTIQGLFGSAAPTPPVVAIMAPANGAQVNPGFPIRSTVDDSDGVAKVELRIDNALVTTLTAGPFAFNAPASMADGTHRVEITAYDIYNTPAKAFVDVIIGKPCGSPGDCPVNTDTCIGGRCVPGSGVAGGLGAACTDSSMCLDGQCASGNAGMVCVSACETGQCPSGFGCVVPMGGSAGVCYPGFDDGTGGGCSTSGGSIGIGLGFALFVASRRRRK